MTGYYRSSYSKFAKSSALFKYHIHSFPFHSIIISTLFHKLFFNFCVTPQSQSLFGGVYIKNILQTATTMRIAFLVFLSLPQQLHRIIISLEESAAVSHKSPMMNTAMTNVHTFHSYIPWLHGQTQFQTDSLPSIPCISVSSLTKHRQRDSLSEVIINSAHALRINTARSNDND